MLARLPFRSKLMLVVSIPLLALVAFAGIVVKDQVDALDAQQHYGKLVGPVETLTAVARTIAHEGVASETFMLDRESDPGGARAALDAARAETDAAAAALERELRSLSGDVSAGTEGAMRLVAGDVSSRLDTFRRAVDAGSVWIAYFGPVARDALDAASDIGRETDTELARGFDAVITLDRRQVALSDEAAIVMHYFRNADASGDITSAIASTGAGAWVTAIAQQQAAAQTFDSDATAAQRRANRGAGGEELAANPIRADRFDGTLPSSLAGTPADFLGWYNQQQGNLDAGRVAVQSVVNDAATSRRDDARTETILVVGVTAAVIVLVVVLAWLVIRAVNRPLRALTRAAREVAERRLPRLVDALHRGGELSPDQVGGLTPIRVDSDDEIGELAKAFSTIQQVTMTVAQEQSELLKKGIGDLYVNLARRNQSLLDRQIELLDVIEAKVEEPDELGSLFELDHLATRMRRNAESLLVLSGAEQPRQWGSAVAVLDVARGAAAEIADFARVTYFGFEGDVAVSGNAVADVSHLLAELLENATAFSPPSTPVVVAGRSIEQRFVITITDEGIGMDDDRLAAANALLARPPAPGLSLSRTLGLYVIAHLGARHGIHVQLRHAPGAGLTAVVALPTSVLARIDTPSAAGTQFVPRPPARGAVPTTVMVGEPVDAVRPAAPVEPVGVGGDHDRGARVGFAATPATPAAPDQATIAWHGTTTDSGLPHRAPGGNGLRTGSSHALASRTPGANLTERPGDRSPSPSGEVRPRPERVAELLNRHDRGKREGRSRPEDRP